jgi:hypothetical protein
MLKENKSIFQFSLFNDVYHKNQVNFKKASLKNIIRSLWVNKHRFLSRKLTSRRFQKSLSGMSVQDLASMTSLVRPGQLSCNLNNETKE